MIDINAFKNYGIKTPRFSLNNLKTYGRLVDIIDGDSLSIILPIYDNYFKSIRTIDFIYKNNIYIQYIKNLSWSST